MTNSKYKILTVVGTRPNFIKVTQFSRLLNNEDLNIEHKIVHTGQHYDNKMAKIFFDQFSLKPDFFLNIDAASPNTQIANIMLKLEELILDYQPNLMMVVGDVNSTLAATITGHKCNIPLIHVESGLRSEDKRMPEENNRVITDSVCDYYLITEQSGWDNLIKEDVDEEKMFFVGNTMIDTLVAFEPQIEASHILDEYELTKGNYILMTIHRPGNVDDLAGVSKLLELIQSISKRYKIVLPLHPRTANRIKQFDKQEAFDNLSNVVITTPMGYFDFQKLIKFSKTVITDSGGIQEETTFRQVPCLTLRPNTERPSTIDIGTNTLVKFSVQEIDGYLDLIETGVYKKGKIPKNWDGHATDRIAKVIIEKIMKQDEK